MTITLKLLFGLWGLIGIPMNILRRVKDWNKAHPDNKVNTPAQIVAFALADTPGLMFSIGAYIVGYGIWMAAGRLSEVHPNWILLVAWANVWNGVISPVFAFVADVVFNKTADRFLESVTGEKADKDDIGQPPLPPPPPPKD